MEECILTVSMQLSEGLTTQFRTSPVIAPHWRLRGITGEAMLESDELPTSAGRGYGPETVVRAQLEALRRNDIPGVYTFASPMNKSATGPLDNFARLFDSPAYKPLLEHIKSESLRRIQLTRDTYAEVLGSNIMTCSGCIISEWNYTLNCRRTLTSHPFNHCIRL